MINLWKQFMIHFDGRWFCPIVPPMLRLPPSPSQDGGQTSTSSGWLHIYNWTPPVFAPCLSSRVRCILTSFN
ncbi:hypothetical protein BLOT_013168 [Blomia tropicalis]|nr:hypothetical protein BLOT_013168 [Blomia tropicalis]